MMTRLAAVFVLTSCSTTNVVENVVLPPPADATVADVSTPDVARSTDADATAADEEPADPPDVAGDAYTADAAADAVDEELVPEASADASECCWIAWTAGGGCCPAPNDPACAYRCGDCDGGSVCCASRSCGVGGCAGSVLACP
jgi:hypothetical protein